MAFELKVKSKESDKYLKDILQNQTAEAEEEEPVITSYNPVPYYSPDAEDDSLLEPLDESLVGIGDIKGDIMKRKGEKSGDFICPVCDKTFCYVKSFNNHLKTHNSSQNKPQTPTLQPKVISYVESDVSSGSEFEIKRMGGFDCSYCEKSFKYVKPYKKHLKQHNVGALTKRGYTRRKITNAPTTSNQAPYDSVSPYGSPAPFKPSTAREPSPDIGMFMINANLMQNEEAEEGPPSKKIRIRKQKLPSRTPSLEPGPEIIENAPRSREKLIKNLEISRSPSAEVSLEAGEVTKRSRGRPRKIKISSFPSAEGSLEADEVTQRSRGQPKKLKISRSPSAEGSLEADEVTQRSSGRPKKLKTSRSPSVEGSLEADKVTQRSRGRPRKNPMETQDAELNETETMLEGFSEVDVSRMLKARTSILDDDSLSQSAPSTSRGRSRSVSVEVVQEFDIFGSVLLPEYDALASTVKSGFGSGTTFPCDARDCKKKFHLRANLKKHQREAHGND